LPEPQRNALLTAFGIASGPPPDRFLVGLSVLNLLSETAAERPLICLVEAAAHTGNTDVAAGALERLAQTTRPAGGDVALGIEARCRALLSGGGGAGALYEEAIDRLGRTQLRPDLARAHLLYGEWLRHQDLGAAAREQLRTAHDMLIGTGMEAFAGRARRELEAAGEKVRQRSMQTLAELTAQEEQIARMAGGGRTNAEIGGQLFLSVRTVEWHLHKVFAKLGIGSRRELPAALAQRG
jgi:DNA-binding CsgD family transcriptional regulator